MGCICSPSTASGYTCVSTSLFSITKKHASVFCSITSKRASVNEIGVNSDRWKQRDCGYDVQSARCKQRSRGLRPRPLRYQQRQCDLWTWCYLWSSAGTRHSAAKQMVLQPSRTTSGRHRSGIHVLCSVTIAILSKLNDNNSCLERFKRF